MDVSLDLSKRAALLAIALVVGGFAGGYMSAPEREYPMCIDDSGASPYPLCVWKAGTQGDGTGASFVSLNGGEIIVYPDGQIVK